MTGDSTHDNTPVPDPTLLTTLALKESITSLREILMNKIEGNEALTKSQFESMDKAIVLLQQVTDSSDSEVEKKISAAKAFINQRFETTEEKFKGIEKQFELRDEANKQTKLDTKEAIAAALSAQKELSRQQSDSFSEAVAKAEGNTTKQIDGITNLIQASTKASDEKFEDIKTRLTLIEGRTAGITENKTSARSDNSIILAVVAVGISLVSFVTLLIEFLRTHP